MEQIALNRIVFIANVMSFGCSDWKTMMSFVLC
jgi:hypothetical protein